MISTELYRGQGFGNQLWVYAATRSIAERLGYEFSIISHDRFKGSSFMNLDFGVNSSGIRRKKPEVATSKDLPNYLIERSLRDLGSGFDISGTDERLLNVSDGSLLDGIMQSVDYIDGYKSQICEWFKTDFTYFDGCVINLRGGEYKGIKNVFLPRDYYSEAVRRMKKIDPNMKFRVVTDDLELAREYFPEMEHFSSGGVRIIAGRFYFSPPSQKIGEDFKMVQGARYLILSNSSFSWWGAWSSQVVQHVMAPKYWAAHNYPGNFWSTSKIEVDGWEWIDRSSYS